MFRNACTVLALLASAPVLASEPPASPSFRITPVSEAGEASDVGSPPQRFRLVEPPAAADKDVPSPRFALLGQPVPKGGNDDCAALPDRIFQNGFEN